MDDDKQTEKKYHWRLIISIFSWQRKKTKPSIPESRQPNPEHHASFFSLLTFSWMSPILAVSQEVSDEYQ